MRRRNRPSTGSSGTTGTTGTTGSTGSTGATGGATGMSKRNSKKVLGTDTGKKVVNVCGACIKDTQTFELQKQFKKKIPEAKLAAQKCTVNTA